MTPRTVSGAAGAPGTGAVGRGVGMAATVGKTADVASAATVGAAASVPEAGAGTAAEDPGIPGGPVPGGPVPGGPVPEGPVAEELVAGGADPAATAELPHSLRSHGSRLQPRSSCQFRINKFAQALHEADGNAVGERAVLQSKAAAASTWDGFTWSDRQGRAAAPPDDLGGGEDDGGLGPDAGVGASVLGGSLADASAAGSGVTGAGRMGLGVVEGGTAPAVGAVEGTVVWDALGGGAPGAGFSDGGGPGAVVSGAAGPGVGTAAPGVGTAGSGLGTAEPGSATGRVGGGVGLGERSRPGGGDAPGCGEEDGEGDDTSAVVAGAWGGGLGAVPSAVGGAGSGGGAASPAAQARTAQWANVLLSISSGGDPSRQCNGIGGAAAHPGGCQQCQAKQVAMGAAWNAAWSRLGHEAHIRRIPSITRA